MKTKILIVVLVIGLALILVGAALADNGFEDAPLGSGRWGFSIYFQRCQHEHHARATFHRADFRRRYQPGARLLAW